MSLGILPSVSIVIAARHAGDTLGGALESCFAQDYEGEFEVVIAIGPDDTETRAAAERYRGRARIVENLAGSTPTGLNRAIEAANGDVVVRCDAQARLPSDYVRLAVETLEETGAANVGGIQRAVGETLFQRAVAIAQSTPLGVGDARYRLGGEPGPVDTVYLGVFRADALRKAGGFDERLERNQDYELNLRLRAVGDIVWFDPRLVVDYLPRETVGRLWRQYYDYGRWKRRVLALHPGSLRWRQLAAPLLVIGLIVSLAMLGLGWPIPGLVIPASYGLALVGTAAWETLRRRDAAGLLTPLALVTMHLAWGLGFLVSGLRHHELWADNAAVQR